MVWLAALCVAPITAQAVEAKSLSAIDLKTIDGKPVDDAVLKGKVVLFVNVASFCGYTPQYGDLQQLYERFTTRGLVVVGVPCNQFGGQEPGTATEIKNFCETTYGVTFPLLSKQDVNGPERSPLYRYLVSSEAGAGRDVGWNFEKFLVGRDGQVIGRFSSNTTPRDPALLAAIEIALARTP